MKAYQVSESDQTAINKLFGGEVFRREEGGKFFVKPSINQEQRIRKQLPNVKLIEIVDKIERFYIKDDKGVASVLNSRSEAEDALTRHNQYMFHSRGNGHIRKAEIPASEVDNITVHNIENYAYAVL